MIVRRNGVPVLLANDGPHITGKAEPIPKPAQGRAITSGEAVALLRSVDPALTPDDVATLLMTNDVPRLVCWDRQVVEALADSLRRSGTTTRRLG